MEVPMQTDSITARKRDDGRWQLTMARGNAEVEIALPPEATEQMDAAADALGFLFSARH
jgi:glutathione synthase/RimK-type ligase-like ATP-grasp enzyme